jgi:hypothetical protein
MILLHSPAFQHINYNNYMLSWRLCVPLRRKFAMNGTILIQNANVSNQSNVYPNCACLYVSKWYKIQYSHRISVSEVDTVSENIDNNNNE